MKELKKLIKELEDSFNRWGYLKEFGGSDPFWEDGCNMNLVRNHILYYKNEMKELCNDKGLELPEIYYRATPEKIDDKYMARVDEIRKNANRALREYKASKDYQYLISIVDSLDKKQLEETYINNVIGYCRGLESYIENDDLVAMRRHERWEHYLQSFWDCRKRVEKILEDVKEIEKEEHIQTCMF